MKKLSYLIGLLLASTWLHAQTIPCNINYLTREDTVYTGQHVKDTACIQIDLVSTFVIEGGASYEAIISGTSGGFLGNTTNPSNFYPTYSPVTPNVGAIELFGTHPVNLSSGLVSIDIPFFTIEAGPVRVPIGLHYHGGGVKVGDVASWVGTNWALNAGGQVSRSVNGRPDEYLGSFLEKGVRTYFNPLDPNVCPTDRGDLERYTKNQLDTGGDLFNFTTPSTSGKFVLVPQSTEVVTIPSDKIKISYTRLDRTYFSEFKLRDENGLLYTFQDREANTSASANFITSATSAWMLNTIEGHAPNQRVEFVYEPTLLSYTTDYQESQTLIDRLTCSFMGGPTEGLSTIATASITTSQTAQQLKEIRFPTGKIEFIRGTQNREDLPNNQFLDQIKLYSFRPATNDFQLVRSVDLDYEYRLNDDGSTKRLFLKEVKLLNRDNNVEGKYVLNYHATALPPAHSMARDWWGRPNGQDSNTSLIPQQTVTAQYAGGAVSVVAGQANREPNAAKMQAGVLTQISYPTGGYTTFEYEPHQYLDGSTPKIAGGLRLKKMQTYASGSSSPIVKTYRYGAGETGNGTLMAALKPEFLSSVQQILINGAGPCTGAGPESYYQTLFTTNYSTSLVPFEGSPVLYDEVTEYTGEGGSGIGKTIHNFRISHQDSLIFIPGPDVFKTKIGQVSFHWDRGQMTQKRVFNQAGQLQYKQQIDYARLHHANSSFAMGLLVYHYFVRLDNPFRTCTGFFPEYFYRNYPVALGNVKPIRTREYVYHNGNTSDYQYKETETDYNNFHYFPTETRTLASGNETLIERFSYAQDYTGTLSSSGNAGGWRRLIERNRYAPIEQVSLRKKSPSDSNPQVIGGTLTTYTVSNNEPVTDKIFSLEVGASGHYLNQSDFSFATTDGSGAVLANAKYLQQVHLSQYDADNNLTQWSGKDGITRGLTWQTYAHNYTNPSTTIRLSLLNTETTGVGTSVAQTTSYQYGLALLGIDQRTDPSGRNNYYFYDNYGRLQRVTDHESKVVAQYSYGYQTGVGSSNRILSETPRVAMNSVSGDYTQVQRSSQHFDGLGRPEQTVLWNGIPSAAKDLIAAALRYDRNGRDSLRYLAFPSNEATNALIDSVQHYAKAFYADSIPYTETRYEASPLGKVTTQFGAGQAWRGATPKAVQTTYANVSGVWRLKATSSGIDRSSNYASGDIVATTTTDEQGHEVITYTDLEGRIIQKAVQESAGNYLRTGYAYDDFGRLAYVIPPKLFAWFGANTTLDLTSTEYQEGAFGYEYDREGRPIVKHVPGAGNEEMVYDQYDRLVWKRTARQAQANKWSFTKYDALNRVVLTGETTNNSDRPTLQTAADAATGHHESRNNVTPVYYSLSGSYPAVSDADVLTINYFDNYDDWRPASMAFNANTAYHSQFVNATGLATGGKEKSEIDGGLLTRATYFDAKNRAIQSFADNHKGGIDRNESQYSFIGEILQNRTLHQKTGQNAITLLEENEFDHLSRKTKTFHTYNGASRAEIAHYSYDAIGRLSQKKLRPDRTYQLLGNTLAYIIRNAPPSQPTQDIASQYVLLQPGFVGTPNYLAQIGTGASTGTTLALQTMDYSYHIRGGLKAINNGQLNATQNDLFGYTLDYEDDGSYFDGNIRKQSWITRQTQQPRSFTYTYDASKRLKTGVYAGIGSENYSLESINYDANGNIQSLIQNGLTGSGSFGRIDQLSYQYQQSNVGNKLQSVSDAISGNTDVSDFRDRNTSTDYAYDASGNLTQDLNKEISSIVYNRLNLPTEINLTGGRWVKYFYTATGQKLRKENSLGDTWDYVGGFVYRADTIYQVAQPEGRLLKIGGSMVYEFEYNDHLNNSRLSFRDSLAAPQSGIYPPPIITQENAYLPFGNRMIGLDYEPSNKNYFNYLSRERQDDFGINWLHLQQRFYDPIKGRFDTQDPVTAEQENYSLYQYSWNSPILRSDPSGDCPNCVTGAIGAGLGALIGGGLEAGMQLYKHGEIKDWKAVGGAALQGGITGGAAGFTGGASLLTTAAVAGTANVVGGTASRAIQGQATTTKDVVVDATLGASLGAGGKVVGNLVKRATDNLSNAAKGRLGEAITEVKYATKGYISLGKAEVQTGARTATGRVQVAKFDHNMRNVFTGNRLTVESKFNTSGLTPNQVAAQSRVTTTGGLIIDRTTSQQVGNVAGAATVGTGAGIITQKNIHH